MSVRIAILPGTADDNPSMAASVATTLALWKETTGIWVAGTFKFASKLATPLATPLWEASSFKANPLFTSVVFAFKLILFDKVAVSAFCNKKLVSVLLNFNAKPLVRSVVFAFKANPLVRSVVFAFKLIRLDKVAVSAFCNKRLVSVLLNFKANPLVRSVVLAFKLTRLDKVTVSALFNFVPSCV